MDIFENFTNVNSKISKGGSVAIGTFDGVHIGHREIIARAAALAAEDGAPSAVFTFKNHPLSLLAPELEPPRITGLAIRREIFEKLGITILMELVFDEKMAGTSAGDFLYNIVEVFHPKNIIVGENFSFGRKAEGTVGFLVDMSEKFGYTANIVRLSTIRGVVISSTKIREFLSAGDISSANEFLGRNFSIVGRVVHGDARGRIIGFPTANLSPDEKQALPADGVYAAETVIDGARRGGVVNIGKNPTFGKDERRIETHIVDFSGDLYGQIMQVEFLSKIRDEKKFSSVNELKAQIAEDVKAARKISEVDAID